jgi:adenosylhomocysteine nucleosidase
MPPEPARHRVAVVLAMPSELAPFRKVAALRRDGDDDDRRCVGAVGDTDVVAITSGMGTALARTATQRLLERGPFDRVVMIGICGGVDTPVGDLVVPEVVIDGPTGAEYRPAPLRTQPNRGALWTSDDMTGADDLGWLRERGIIGVDMETAAVAAVCEAAGMPWSTIRAVSDPVGPPGADEAIFGLARPDGSPNFGAVARYLIPRFWRIGRLLVLARGASKAANAAAQALHRELAAATGA